MTVPSLGKFLVPAMLAAGAVFSVCTAPLALFGSEPITLEMKGTEVLKGNLKDIAVPYLGLASALSLGVGVTSLALAGWQQSSRRSGKLEQQVSGMQDQLKEKEGQIQEFLLSDRNLETTGLQFFLEDEDPIESVPTTRVSDSSQTVAQTVTQTVAQNSLVAAPIVQTSAQVAQPLVFTSSAAPSRSEPVKTIVQTAVSPLQAAQAFLSFSRAGTPASAAIKPAWTQVTSASSESAVAQIGELQTQLQQLMAQLEILQAKAWCESHSAPNPRSAADSVITAMPQARQRLQKLEPQRVMQVAAL